MTGSKRGEGKSDFPLHLSSEGNFVVPSLSPAVLPDRLFVSQKAGGKPRSEKGGALLGLCSIDHNWP